MLKSLKPLFFENSLVPVWLSKVAPININAITLFCFVFSRGKISDRTRVHETIHFQQFLECGIIPFILIYYLDYLVKYIAYRGDGKRAYRSICFEREAHHYDDVENYLETRKRYCWVRLFRSEVTPLL